MWEKRYFTRKMFERELCRQIGFDINLQIGFGFDEIKRVAEKHSILK